MLWERQDKERRKRKAKEKREQEEEREEEVRKVRLADALKYYLKWNGKEAGIGYHSVAAKFHVSKAAIKAAVQEHYENEFWEDVLNDDEDEDDFLDLLATAEVHGPFTP